MPGEPGEPRRAATIRDVAERAGVSKSLVSLVLRNSGPVREDKRQAVLAAVAELDYRPNAAARSLSERRTRTVGLLLNDLRNPWFVDLLHGVHAVLHDQGLHALLADAHLSRRIGEDLTRTFLDLGVDGLIAVGTQPDPAAVRTAAGLLPTVVAGTREPVLRNVDVVANDDELGTRLATDHLVDLGHRRVAHITGPGAVGELRHRSFLATTAGHGLADVRVETGDGTEEGGYRAMVRLLADDPRPTAVVAFNDLTAVGAMSAAEESGLTVPRDLSIVGYDNTSISRLRHLWLTTVDNASYEVGRRAARMLLRRIEDRSLPAELSLSTPTLQVRGTTAPAAPAAPGR